MKKVLISMAVLSSLTAFAQCDRHHREALQDMSAEQVATLHTKKMALSLDLTEEQQQEVLKINLENAEFRKAKMEERKALKDLDETKKRATDEKYADMNDHLDRQLAEQSKMKNVLTEEQYLQWKKLKQQKRMRSKKKMQRRGERE